MKKLFFSGIVLGALFVAYSVYGSQKSERFSDITLANIEVLSGDDEPSGGFGECFSRGVQDSSARYKECGNPCVTVVGYRAKGRAGMCYY